MNEFILTTPEQLDEIVQRAIRKSLPVKKEEKPRQFPDTCSMEQAIEFLAEHGYRLSKSKLYKLTSTRQIPFRYFGRRLVFSREELLAWVERQTVSGDNTAEVLLSLAESARRKYK